MRLAFYGRARLIGIATAVALLLIGNLPLLAPLVYAGQVTARSIEMSSSQPSLTSVQYAVSFTPATNGGVINGIVVDFCMNSPLIGDSNGCTTTNGPSVTSSPAISGMSLSIGTWTASTNGSAPYHTLILTNGSGNTGSTSTPVTFTITTMVNPTTANTTFFARVLTYTTTGGASSYTSASPGSYEDYGGDALSTASVISITATVSETLTFCTSSSAPLSGCSGLTTPNLTIGHGNPPILDNTQVDTATAYTQISSNDQSGTIVRMIDSNTSGCTNGGLKSGSNCIPGIGAFGSMSAGTADFGLNVANGTGGIGTVTANPNYGPTSNKYGMGSSVTSTYGDPIESSSGATANVNSLLTFAATASPVTPAGIYTASMTLIATGTF